MAIFGLITYGATIFSLHDEDFSGIEWAVLPILPVFFAVSSVLLFPLLPPGVYNVFGWTLSPDTAVLLALFLRIAFLALFAVGYYAALLTSNIFNIAAIRSIQLLRVAHSIGFLVAVATALFFFIVIASLHLTWWLIFFIVFAVSLPLAFSCVWSVNLGSRMGEKERNLSLIIAFVIAQIALILSFWPVGVSIFALFLTAIFYELVGIVQYHVGERLNRQLISEFVLVAAAVFILTILTTSWTG